MAQSSESLPPSTLSTAPTQTAFSCSNGRGNLRTKCKSRCLLRRSRTSGFRFGRVSPSSDITPNYTHPKSPRPFGDLHTTHAHAYASGLAAANRCLDPPSACQKPHRSLATSWTREGLGLISIVRFTLPPTLTFARWLSAFPVWASPNSAVRGWFGRLRSPFQ